jgi:hypothetical protein
MAIIGTLPNKAFVVGPLDVGPFPVPSLSGTNGLQVTLSRSGLPAGRAADGKLCDFTVSLSYDGGVTFPDTSSCPMVGGVILHHDGVTPEAATILNWYVPPIAPTHVQLHVDCYVAFTSTITASTF